MEGMWNFKRSHDVRRVPQFSTMRALCGDLSSTRFQYEPIEMNVWVWIEFTLAQISVCD